jgi:DNA modification methylase
MKTATTSKKHNVRLFHILNSAKNYGSAVVDSERYLRELNVEIEENKQPIQFYSNYNEYIHKWAPYVQGFSASFVQSIIDKYKGIYKNPFIMDPFAGCGTVSVQAKLNGLKSFGVELNPYLQYVANTKLNTWEVDSKQLLNAFNSLRFTKLACPPPFLRSNQHFNPGVLTNLLKIKYAINSLNTNPDIKNILRLAFSSILIDVSNLKRSPCLGYDVRKKVKNDAPFTLLDQKIRIIAEDLRILREHYAHRLKTFAQIVLGNSATFKFPHTYDLVITSPPYMNGMDYVMNYKIEMAWLDFIKNHKQAKKIKDEMVVCDNVSKKLIKNFSESNTYTNRWIENIKQSISTNIARRGSYRRSDMPHIVHKYFDDMYRIIKNVAMYMNLNARLVMVIGDSLIADVYIPTDLILARIGSELGLSIESIQVARHRRSGQIRSYRLRETIVTLKKENG